MDGFYIGRYEVGDGDATSRNVGSGISHTPVEMQGKYPYNYISWYNAYDLSKEFSGTNGAVNSCLIYGCLWDATLEYLVKTENKEYSEIVDSTSWGNYRNATFNYINISKSEKTKSINSGTLIPTGSTEYTSACNIYDLAGNIWEWTQETESSSMYRYDRGGYNYDYGNDCFVSSRNDYDNIYGRYASLGFRAILYLQS